MGSGWTYLPATRMLIAEDPPRTLPLERNCQRDARCAVLAADSRRDARGRRWQREGGRREREGEGAPGLRNDAAVDGGLRDGHEAPVDALVHDAAAGHAYVNERTSERATGGAARAGVRGDARTYRGY